jgi:hypothetical protein
LAEKTFISVESELKFNPPKDWKKFYWNPKTRVLIINSQEDFFINLEKKIL